MLACRILVFLCSSAAVSGKFYGSGYGWDQTEGKMAKQLPYVHFNTSWTEHILREMTIIGRFTEPIKNGPFVFNMKLEHNETLAEKFDYNWMSYELQVNGALSTNRGYFYTLTGKGVKVKAMFVSINRAHFRIGEEFTLRVVAQPSHFLFILDYAGRNPTQFVWRNYYGYFYEPDDKNSHWGEFTDSIFDSLHLEGDVIISSVTLHNGGAFTRPANLNLVFHPLMAHPDKSFNAVKYFIGEDVDTTAEGNWELNLRGRIGNMKYSNDVTFKLWDETLGMNFVALTADMSQANEINIEAKAAYSRDDMVVWYTDKYWPSFATVFQTLWDKHSKNPLKRNTNFEMSIRRLGNSGFARTTMQLTVRVACRIWTWYFQVSDKFRLNLLEIIGDVAMHEVLLVSSS